jgi:ribosomal protein L44E
MAKRRRIEMEYNQIPENQWDFASCDNPKCLRHPKNGGAPNQHYPKYSNGRRTFCDVCMQTSSVMRDVTEMTADKLMTEDMGGEIAWFIRRWQGRTIRCFGVCSKDRVMDEFKGYRHDGGFMDKEGKKWWIYFECPECKYGHSGTKMEFFERHTRIEHGGDEQ